MRAQQTYDTAPLGSLIRFSNGEARPPARFTRKVRAWEDDNGGGRLVERSPECIAQTYRSSASFVLHVANYGSQGTIVLVVNRGFSVTSPLDFEITEMPRPGMVRLLTPIGGHEYLQHLAADMADAERWMAIHHYHNIRAEVVGDPDHVALPPVIRRAA